MLSGEPTFERVTGNTNYDDFYRARLELMRIFYEAHLDKYNDLILYYNKLVFRHDYLEGDGEIEIDDGVISAPDAGMSQADMAFMEGL